MSILDEMVELNKQYTLLCAKGLIGAMLGQNQISIHQFLESFDEYEVIVDYRTAYPYRFYTEYDGVEFVAVADRDDLERYSK